MASWWKRALSTDVPLITPSGLLERQCWWGSCTRLSANLRQCIRGRKSPLDGHLVGSISEAAAEPMFDLVLVPASSAGHDAIAGDGRRVEIKATYGSSAVAIRQTSHGAAAALIVLKLSRTPGAKHEVVFYGPLAIAQQAAGSFESNGQARMGLSRLRGLDLTVPPEDRVPQRLP